MDTYKQKLQSRKLANPPKEYSFGINTKSMISLMYYVQWQTARRYVLEPDHCSYIENTVDSFTLRAKLKYKIFDIDVSGDHVSFFLQTGHHVDILMLVKGLKRRLAKGLKELDPDYFKKKPSIWTNENLISTVGAITLDDIDQFEKMQKGVL